MTNRDLSVIVTHYDLHYRASAAEELAYFAAIRPWREAVAVAAHSRVDGLKLSHQRRIPPSALAQAADRLRTNADAVRRVRSFDELHDMVNALIRPIPKIGELAVYDIALRIGSRLRRLPDRVHLHAGTRAGTKALGLNWRAGALMMTEVPDPFRVLEPYEIEDVLCIYKNCFKTGDVTEFRRACDCAAAAGGSDCRPRRPRKAC